MKRGCNVLFIITLNGKPATVQQLHNNEGWTYYAVELESELHTEAFITAPTARDCRLAYEAALGIVWSQKQGNVRAQNFNPARKES